MQTHWHGERFDRIGSIKRAASMAAPTALRDEAFLLRKPAKHLNRHGLARSEYSRRHRHAVGRDENAAVSNIEENAERCGLVNHTGDRDKVVLVGHHMGEVRTIPCNGKRYIFAVGAAPYGFQHGCYATMRRVLSAR